MDKASRVYSSLLAGETAYLAKVNPQLAAKTLEEKAEALKKAGVQYTVEGGLKITEAPENSGELLYQTILDLAAPYEKQYGVNKLWNPLKTVIVKVFQKNRDVVRETGMEVPVAKYEIEYMILETLFGFQGTDFRKKRWINGAVLVTNHEIVLPEDGGAEHIPLQAVATVGREIYVGYEHEMTKGIVRAIDYQVKESGMSCAVLLAKGELMKEFMKVASVMRAEYRRLNPTEERILLALYDETPVEQLAGKTGVKGVDVTAAFKRLMELRYTDGKGHLTSYGINASMELKQRGR